MDSLPHNYLQARIYQALAQNDNAEALVLSNQTYSSQEIRDHVFALSSFFREHQLKRVALLAYRSVGAYVSVYASLLERVCYVPLNSYLPQEKSAFVLQHSDAKHLLVSPECFEYAAKVFRDNLSIDYLNDLILILTPQAKAYFCEQFKEEDQQERLQAILNNALELPCELDELNLASFADQREYLLAEDRGYSAEVNEVIYIMSTSGSTGSPKCVVVSYDNYAHYFAEIEKLYNIKADDRVANFAEITFDITVQDILLPLFANATLVCPSVLDLFSPYRCIKQYKITAIQTAPYISNYVKRMLSTKTDKQVLECLRLVIFVGEALWSNQVAFFESIFPNARIFNTYGPTETTVIASFYEVPKHLYSLEQNPVRVPIGYPLKSAIFKMEDGKLLIGGSQVAIGYHKEPEKSKNSFIELDGVRFFRTGDMVKEEEVSPQEHNGYLKIYHFLGRQDDLIKIKSNRVSLYEVDEKLGELTQKPVRTLAYELPELQEVRLCAVVENATQEELEFIRAGAKDKLIKFMQPSAIFTCDKFPTNINSKVDRNALKAMMAEQALAELRKITF